MNQVLKENGRYLLASFKTKQLLQMLWTSRFGTKKVIYALSLEKREDLIKIKDLVEAGAIKTVIDRCYPLEETAEAHRYIESGQVKGHVIISLQPNKSTIHNTHHNTPTTISPRPA